MNADSDNSSKRIHWTYLNFELKKKETENIDNRVEKYRIRKHTKLNRYTDPQQFESLRLNSNLYL